MNKIPNIFVINPNSSYMTPGAVDFVPAWIILIIAAITIGNLFSGKFQEKNTSNKNLIISPLYLAFLMGTLMPIADDILAFVFGPPFAHHSLFHSFLTGLPITFLLFYFLAGKKVAAYATLGNLTHTLFNYIFDTVTLFFPLTYQQFGLTEIVGINTYWIKAAGYPLIFLLYCLSAIRYFRKFRS